jgi:hypothetical protein
MEAMVVDPLGCSQYDKSVGRIGILNGCRSHEPLFSASIILALTLKMLIGGAPCRLHVETTESGSRLIRSATCPCRE